MTAIVVRQGAVWPKDAPTKTAILQSALPDSIYIQWEVNNTYQAQFTAWDDGSEAFNMLAVQNSVLIDGEWFVIKQAEPDYSGGIDTIQITATHVYLDWAARCRAYKATSMRWKDENGTLQNPDVKTGRTADKIPASEYTSSSSDSSDSSSSSDDEITKSWTPQNIIEGYITKQSNITFSYHGNFTATNIVVNQDLSYSEVLSLITDNWTDSVIYPNGLDIGIYTSDEFYKDHGTRVDYLHDTQNLQLTYDTTSVTNGARLIGASYTLEGTSSDSSDGSSSDSSSSTSSSKAQEIIDYAKQYVGEAYAWGGPRGVDQIVPTDCSGMTSNIYKHFGITIGTVTTTQENDGTVISRDQVQTGDLGFYGSKGATYHVVMALDNTQAIQEPQPGEVCNIFKIDSYQPSFWIRNAQMAALVGSGASADSSSSSSSSSVTAYYFTPFWYQNQESVDRWGLFTTEDITDDEAHSEDEAKEYADKKFSLNPEFSLEVTFNVGDKIQAGDMAQLIIREVGYSTKLKLVGYQTYPYSLTAQPTATYNSNLQNILDYQNALAKRTAKFEDWIKNNQTLSSQNQAWITRIITSNEDSGGTDKDTGNEQSTESNSTSNASAGK